MKIHSSRKDFLRVKLFLFYWLKVDSGKLLKYMKHAIYHSLLIVQAGHRESGASL